MANQGDPAKREDSGFSRGSNEGENKTMTCPLCSGTCQGANCSQFPSLQVGVRQAHVPRRHQRSMIPELNESSVGASSSSHGTEQLNESSVGASSSSHGTEHTSVNQVQEAEQAVSLPFEKLIYDLYMPPIEIVDELTKKPSDYEAMGSYVDYLLMEAEEGSRPQRPSSSSHPTGHLTVTKVDATARPSSLRASSRPYVPLQRHLPPSPVQDTTALEKKLISKEELENYVHNVVQAELVKCLSPCYMSPLVCGLSPFPHDTLCLSLSPFANSLGYGLTSNGVMHPSFNQVEAPNSSTRGRGYHSPHRGPLPRPPVQGRSSSGGRHSFSLGRPPSPRPPLPPPKPPLGPSCSQVAETSIITKPNTSFSSSDWTPQDVILSCGSTEEKPMDIEELRRIFCDIVRAPASGGSFPASKRSADRTDTRN